MTIRRDLKKVMNEIKAGVKAHRRLQKSAFRPKKVAADDRDMLSASRKKLQTLFAREEEFANRLLARTQGKKRRA